MRVMKILWFLVSFKDDELQYQNSAHRFTDLDFVRQLIQILVELKLVVYKFFRAMKVISFLFSLI